MNQPPTIISSSEKKEKPKPIKEIKVKVSESTETIADFISEDTVKKHMSRSKTYPMAKLYSKNGVELRDDDIAYMKSGDVVYLARHGEPFNYQQVMDRYEKISKLGSGGFGKVYLMKDKERPDQYYAVKVINMSEYMQKADGIYEIDREAKTLRMLNSKYIIQLENYFLHGQKEIILVMEYAQGGELKQYINRKGGRLTEYETQQLIKQIVTGLASCHQRGIIHRDLKLENILFMDKECTHLKIVDFGIAGFCLKHLKEKTDAGTFKYMSPEVLKGDINLANPSMDIWALGIMMFLMLFGYHPFFSKKEILSKDYDIKTLIGRIINDPLVIPQPNLNSEDNSSNSVVLSNDCKDLLSRLLIKKPRDRIQLLDVQFHPWFNHSEQDILESQQDILNKLQQEQERQRQQKLQQYSKTLQKRSTLPMPLNNNGGGGGAGKYSVQPKMSLQHGSTLHPQNGSGSGGQRKMSQLSPIDIMRAKQKFEEVKKNGAIGKKKITPFELEEAAFAVKKMVPMSPMVINKQNQNQNIFKLADKR